MTTERDLIRQLTNALEVLQKESVTTPYNQTIVVGGVAHSIPIGNDVMARDAIYADLLFRARAYLDQPEPEDKVLARVEFAKGDFNNPFDEILARYCDYWFYSDPERTEVDPMDLCRGAIKLFAHYALSIPPATEKP